MLVVVTVESPRGRITLAAPNDVPVEQLISELVEVCHCEGDGSLWTLRARGEEGALAPGRTLDQCGLYRGAVLELKAEEPPTARVRRPQFLQPQIRNNLSVSADQCDCVFRSSKSSKGGQMTVAPFAYASWTAGELCPKASSAHRCG